MAIHKDSTAIRAKGNGTRKWEATVPLLSVPDHTAKRFATALVNIANGKLSKYEFGVAMLGSGVMQGRVELTDGHRDMVTRWLRSLPSPKKPVLGEIADALREIEWTQSEMVAEPGSGRVDFGINVAMQATNPKSVLAFMVASVLHSGYAENIRQCPKETTRTKCGLWFADFPVNRALKKYCTPQHQNQHAKYLSISRKARGRKAK